MFCRNCSSEIKTNFLDLGHSPPSNAYLTKDQLSKKELYFPLKVGVCEKCWLVQTEDYVAADDLFTRDYAYLSSASESWLSHCKKFVDHSIELFSITKKSFVIEVAANDGYLLQYFQKREISCLGVEPTEYAAKLAREKGLTIINQFLTLENAKNISLKYGKADLVIGNNVYAHVPDINDFTLSLKELIKDNGVISLEFPHLMQLIKEKQFDTIYHEHFSYLSLTAVTQIFKKAGLRIFKVEELNTHGGSLRVFGCLNESIHLEDKSVRNILYKEEIFGLTKVNTYKQFQEKADLIKNNLIELLLKLKKDNKSVMAYGAAAKGNTLLNYGGIKKDLVRYVFDKAESKQNKFLPGSHIQILNPNEIAKRNPDYLLILPWNISDEIISSLNKFLDKDLKFIIAVPEIKII